MGKETLTFRDFKIKKKKKFYCLKAPVPLKESQTITIY